MGSRGATAGVIAELGGRVVSPILLAEIVWQSGITRAWSGWGELSWNGQTWTGTGDLAGVSSIQESTELRANGIQLHLDGIDPAYLSIALQDAAHGNTVKIWFGLLDVAGAIVADPLLMFSGLVDQPMIEEGEATSRIVVRAESEMIDLKRPRLRRYTDEDQQSDYPGDLFFEFVSSLREREVKWK